MKTLLQFIKDAFSNDDKYHDMLVEMANIQKNVELGKNHYNIAIHGPSSKDRENPHIHIYLTGDNTYKQFNFEISLVDIICKDEINLIRMLDRTKKHKVDIKNRNECSWEGYSKLEESFEEWLYDKASKRGDFVNNLDVVIYTYNEEASDLSKNYFLEYLRQRNLKVLKKFNNLFTDEDKENFKECFQ